MVSALSSTSSAEHCSRDSSAGARQPPCATFSAMTSGSGPPSRWPGTGSAPADTATSAPLPRADPATQAGVVPAAVADRPGLVRQAGPRSIVAGQPTGGEFLLVEQRPRAQSRGTATRLPHDHGYVFTTRDRPVRSARGWSAVRVRHGVSAVPAARGTPSGWCSTMLRETSSATTPAPTPFAAERSHCPARSRLGRRA